MPRRPDQQRPFARLSARADHGLVQAKKKTTSHRRPMRSWRRPNSRTRPPTKLSCRPLCIPSRRGAWNKNFFQAERTRARTANNNQHGNHTPALAMHEPSRVIMVSPCFRKRNMKQIREPGNFRSACAHFGPYAAPDFMPSPVSHEKSNTPTTAPNFGSIPGRTRFAPSKAHFPSPSPCCRAATPNVEVAPQDTVLTLLPRNKNAWDKYICAAPVHVGRADWRGAQGVTARGGASAPCVA